MYKTGEKPGKGTYACTRDNEVIHLDQDTDALPPCPRCNNIWWRRL